ncbi:NTP transferase domain-containing protein [Pseudomonas chlororaphis]|uniref:NTP transferase domain-containing protein n=1 Tax=Pseudomonas chlororaphis TaxID=587753 RepID=UPI00215B4A9B|nr:NTP transferase domain-containing protein [Pseudomonas chlororaphis]UVE43919.1 NTP transferase domain-containing protein [Pseudomonas chlororaphis]
MTQRADLPPCSILLLAGGRGQRMGGRDKGLIEWQGRPLIAHLHRLTRSLSDDLIISCNRNRQQYAPYADQLVQDESNDFPGPLAGIRAGLAVARHTHLLVLPCDVPRIDAQLIDAMRQSAAPAPGQTADAAPWRALGTLAVYHSARAARHLRRCLAER